MIEHSRDMKNADTDPTFMNWQLLLRYFNSHKKQQSVDCNFDFPICQ